MTSCGCFEVICAYVPECNGVMVVNREFPGETPVGMNFSTLAGIVGGGQQTPGFMGCGKVFLSSKKFLHADGGHRRLVWMPRELKDLLADDLKKRFQEQGVPDLMDQLADEKIATEPSALRDFLDQNNHPALKMEDMGTYAQSVRESAPPEKIPDQDSIKISAEKSSKLSETIPEPPLATIDEQHIPDIQEPLIEINSFDINREKCEIPIWKVKLGATKKEGGTRKITHTIGGETCMPFHLWEGEMPCRPLIAMEVFDSISEKYPGVLRKIYGDLLENPAQMAQTCIEKFGADLISVRLEGTHPEKGDRTLRQSVDLVKSILKAVEVPLIITGHKHYDKNNEVMKAVAQECAGENLLLNWVEQDNYRTIASAALAYGHTLAAQSPIDVNIAKQMNILLNNMDVKTEKIVMDPMTGAAGYGIEYTYSVMERIRITALNGDQMLAGPMIGTPGQECANVKEYRAEGNDFPAWGDLQKRASLWELSTGLSLLYSGADLLIMYHPEAAKKIKQVIFQLMKGRIK
jgi:acetyl-CoA decarbonylase/synthase complex subunit delta